MKLPGGNHKHGSYGMKSGAELVDYYDCINHDASKIYFYTIRNIFDGWNKRSDDYLLRVFQVLRVYRILQVASKHQKKEVMKLVGNSRADSGRSGTW